MKKIVVLLLLLYISLQSLVATNLAIINLENVSDDELLLMCKIRNLECDKSREEIKNTLKKQFEDEYGQDKIIINQKDAVKDIEDSFSFDIKNANTLKLINDISSLIILEGNVELVFNFDKDEKTINAQKIILDIDNKNLVALVNVSYSSNESTIASFSQEISGDIISYDWENDKLKINNGIITTQRYNSENESVTFYASSSTMDVDSINNSLVLNNGYITTNINTSYFSISADNISILNQGDMYFEGAKISIGRVPVLYLPFFFSPGATMLGNPAIGYEYSRGSFVNTTFEIFGKYPSFKSTSSNSFNTLLENDNSSYKYSEGAIYKNAKSDDKLNIWADQTDSYLALMFDVYEKTPNSIDLTSDYGSIVFSYAYELNLLKDSLKLQSSAITSFASDGENELNDINYYPKFRYNFEFKTTFNMKNGKIEFYIPLISDPKVKKSYGNRLSTFSIDSLWNSNQSFPTTYNSDISSYSSYIKSNYTYTLKYLTPIISQIKINKIEAQIDYDWTLENGEYTYVVDKITLPDFDFNVIGTLLNITSDKKNTTKKESETNENKKSDILDKLYSSNIFEDNNTSAKSSQINISYTLDNDYSSTYNDDIDDTYNQTIFNLKTSANLAPNIIAFNNKIKFNYIYDENSEDEDEKESSIDLLSTNEISFDKINLNYYLDTSIYEWERIENSEGIISNTSIFEFSDEYITRHEFELLDTYNLYDLKVTPAINLVIPPLNWALKPSLNLALGNIFDKTIFTFDISSTNFELTQIDNNLDLVFNNLSLSFDFSFDIEEYYAASNIIDPLKIDTSIIYYDKDNNQYFSHSNTFYGLYNNENNFFSKFNFTYKNSFLVSRLNFYSENETLALDYFKNTISFKNLEKYWWKNRIGLKLDLDLTFNYSQSDIYSTYFSLESNINYRIAKFLLLDFNIKTSNYSFDQYYDNSGENFNFNKMFIDLLKSFDFFNGGRYSTQFNLESISLDLVHMMEDWDLHCKYEGSVVLSNYNYQWVPSVSIFLQWKALPELKVDQSF